LAPASAPLTLVSIVLWTTPVTMMIWTWRMVFVEITVLLVVVFIGVFHLPIGIGIRALRPLDPASALSVMTTPVHASG